MRDDTQPCELSPLDIVALEAYLDPFCPISAENDVCHPDICQLRGCTLCMDLLLTKGGTA